MAKQFPALDAAHRSFIARQRIFFTASSAGTSHVNVSPRSTEALRILDANTVAYLDLTGSGNETAAHIKAGGKVTVMFCAYDGPPLILRLFGKGTVVRAQDAAFPGLLATHFGGVVPAGTRQIVRIAIEIVQTSCGFGVPLFDFKGERDSMRRWAAAKTDAELEAYRREKNTTSMDGLPTGLLDPPR